MITPGSSYVSLGSSFAAGPGIKPTADKAAGRSARNYAHLVADTLGLDLTDVTYSGSTTAHLLRERQEGAPPQIDAIGPDTALVTITAGGNDLDYIGTFIRGSKMNTLAKPAMVLGKRVANRIRARVSYLKAQSEYDAVADSLVEVVVAVRKRAPQSRILLVDYLTVAGPATRPRLDVPLNEEQLPSVVMMADGLARAFATAADRSGAELVAASAASKDHAVGSAEPWTSGFKLLGVPYHPTAPGMVAVANLIVGKLQAG